MPFVVFNPFFLIPEMLDLKSIFAGLGKSLVCHLFLKLMVLVESFAEVSKEVLLTFSIKIFKCILTVSKLFIMWLFGSLNSFINKFNF